MSPHPLSPFLLERWFVEFEFVPGIRNLTASGPYDATTQELLALEDEGTTERYLSLGLGYIENPGGESLRQAVSSLYTTLKAEDIQNAIGIGDMTKPWGLGGLRIGWIASRNHHLLQRVSEACDYSTMCSSVLKPATPPSSSSHSPRRHSAVTSPWSGAFSCCQARFSVLLMKTSSALGLVVTLSSSRKGCRSCWTSYSAGGSAST